MPTEITPEQREAALEILRTKLGAAANSAITESWEVADFFAPITLDALIAAGWGPTADAEARGYRAGLEDAVKECRIAAADVLRGRVRPGQPRLVVTRPMARMAIRCAIRIRALADKPKETPHG